MLLSLQVRNFAIIDAIDVEFQRGMTVLTGETGAGKSILVDALGLVLGERGGTGLVRPGAERAEFTAEFDLSDRAQIRQWLADLALDADDACIVRRVIASDGRSRAFVNGNAAPLQTLKELGEQLLDIHGQHFHQSLGRRDVQRDLIDHFGKLQSTVSDVAAAHAHWQSKAARLRELQDAQTDRASRIDLLSFQARELAALDLAPGEHESLVAERQRLRLSSQLVEALGRAMKLVFEDDQGSAQPVLAEACHELDAASRIDPRLEGVRSLLEEASIQVGEAAESLQRYRENLDLDPGRQDWVEERLDAVSALARKHRVEPEALSNLRESLERQLDELGNAEAIEGRLAGETQEAAAAYLKIANSLSAARRKAALAFAKQVTSAMHGLGMPDGRFEVEFHRRDPEDAAASGIDDVSFLISANPGQPLLPLSRIASGGELSRMSLAIQVIASDGGAIPTMVFDEVDSGVGGAVAEMVGRRLAEIGETRQVFCVTHLPQVASVADHHFHVVKQSDAESTRTEVRALSEKQKVEELARMLGGVEVTEKSRLHAAEMRKLGKRPAGRRRRLGSAQ